MKVVTVKNSLEAILKVGIKDQISFLDQSGKLARFELQGMGFWKIADQPDSDSVGNDVVQTHMAETKTVSLFRRNGGERTLIIIDRS